MDERKVLATVEKLFPSFKHKILTGLQQPEETDKSKKGGVDAPIVDLIELINNSIDYVTTSSCSGRVSIFVAKPEHTKSSGEWLFISHDQIKSFEEIQNCFTNISEYPEKTLISFKFEPFIVHVMCRSLQAARKLHHLVSECGFKNSGITVGKNKIVLAIRSTILLDVPIAYDGQKLVDENYLIYLMNVANQKFVENVNRINKLTEGIKSIVLPKNQGVIVEEGIDQSENV